MITVTERLISSGDVDAEIKDTICLPFDDRKRGRFKTTTESGLDVGIFVERGNVMRDGTLLRSDAGDVFQIRSADEEVTTASTDDSHLFARACYHLGNRHVPLQVGEGWLRYQNDYVLDDMLRQLGLVVIQEQAPFEPENGAYDQLGGHHEGGRHDRDHHEGGHHGSHSHDELDEHGHHHS